MDTNSLLSLRKYNILDNNTVSNSINISIEQ